MLCLRVQYYVQLCVLQMSSLSSSVNKLLSLLFSIIYHFIAAGSTRPFSVILMLVSGLTLHWLPVVFVLLVTCIGTMYQAF